MRWSYWVTCMSFRSAEIVGDKLVLLMVASPGTLPNVALSHSSRRSPTYTYSTEGRITIHSF